MTQTDRTSPTLGAFIYFAIIAALSGLTLYAVNSEWIVLVHALIGPAIMLAEAGGLEESAPLIIAIAFVYLSLILAPTGARLIRGKWNPALVILQILLLLPNAALGFFAFIITGIQM